MKVEERLGISADLLALRHDELGQVLTGPTLFHIEGLRNPPLFVSILAHGNEPVGWDAMRSLLGKWSALGRTLPRSLYLLITNPDAAARNTRHLAEQPDFNRIWPGTEDKSLPEAKMMANLVKQMKKRGLFASVDLHNNTGLNPHYGCVNQLRAEDLYLASLFSRIVVYFTQPKGVQSMAMSEICPAVTLECGKSGQQQGVEHAIEFLEACLHVEDLSQHQPHANECEIFHTQAIVKVPAHMTFAFHPDEVVDLRFRADLDTLNFRELPAGTPLASVHTQEAPPLDLQSESGPGFDHYFEVKAGQLLTKTPLMPSMLTLNHTNIRQDCLCYLMMRMEVEMGGGPTSSN